ncbi:hypothetical protein BC831DRAFT_475882 [Entophlyctis helioformis]|nr:hypothetical protein BC831DRAFT_475882 [Entophlyctis helioformis]
MQANAGLAKSNADLLEALTEDLTNEVYDCMVCYDTVKARDSIWNCGVCFAPFHLKCVSKWAARSQDTNATDPTRSMESWRCPGCHRPTIHGTPIACFCGKGELVVRCTEVARIDFMPSCGQTCTRLLDCGNHTCTMLCHPPPCHPCSETVAVKCFCGADSKGVPCGQSPDGFSCGKMCEFTYACGVHTCDRPCHAEPHQDTEICPLDPSVVTRCPCSKHSVEELTAGKTPRTSCEQPVITCKETCRMPLPCGHECADLCHTGPCDPCPLLVSRKCRCGKETIKIRCKNLDCDPVTGEPLAPLCARPCGKRLHCRRHQCQDTCCPKSDAEHECDAVCGKTLACKKHPCMMPCGHQGKCHDCVEGVSFDERACNCGRTVQYPPIPCNAPPLKCNYPCTRRRTCGHPTITQHYCHDDSEPACGDKIMKNIPCSRQGAPSCGSPCKGRITACDHPCRRVCHTGPCADETHPCVEKCGRVRSSCGHTCQYNCHGTPECPETSYCRTPVTLKCPCGNRVKQSVCGSTRDKPVTTSLTLECDESCNRKRRNERLADALGIDPLAPSAAATSFTFPETLVRAAFRFKDVVAATEATLATLVEEPSTQFYYFPKQRLAASSALIVELATLYGFFAQIIDANVGKPTVVVRRIKDRTPAIPPKLLSKVAEEYDPLAPAVSADIAPAETVETPTAADELLALEPFVPNAILVRGVPLDAELSNIKAILKPICTTMNLAAKLHWITDADFVVSYERMVAWGSIKDKDAEIPSMLADRVNAAMALDLGWASEVVECQILSSRAIRLADKQVLKRDSGTLLTRGTLAQEEGWTTVRQSRNPGIPINDDIAVPGLPLQDNGAASGSYWFDEE